MYAILRGHVNGMSHFITKKSLLLIFVTLTYLYFISLMNVVAQEPTFRGKRIKVTTIRGFKTRHVDGEIIVKFKPSVAKDKIEKFNKLHGVKIIKYLDPPMDMYHLAFPTSKTITKIMKIYEESGLIEFVDCNGIAKGSAPAAPEDTYYKDGSQWSLSNIHVPEAWDLEKGSQNVVIAVIDSGINYLDPA